MTAALLVLSGYILISSSYVSLILVVVVLITESNAVLEGLGGRLVIRNSSRNSGSGLLRLDVLR